MEKRSKWKSPAPATAATLIQAVRENRGDGHASVEIRGNGHLRYETLRLNNPDRLVLDFAGTRLSAGAREVTGAEPVRGVRLGQFKPDVSRIVVDLVSGTPYTINPGKNSITVDFGVASGAVEAKPEKMTVWAVEAAEQCGRLDLPEGTPPPSLYLAIRGGRLVVRGSVGLTNAERTTRSAR